MSSASESEGTVDTLVRLLAEETATTDRLAERLDWVELVIEQDQLVIDDQRGQIDKLTYELDEVTEDNKFLTRDKLQLQQELQNAISTLRLTQQDRDGLYREIELLNGEIQELEAEVQSAKSKRVVINQVISSTPRLDDHLNISTEHINAAVDSLAEPTLWEGED